MTNVEWIVMGVLTVLVALLVIGTVRLEREQLRNKWIHPPDDDDGVSILEDDDDA